jgi:hypothetical protein
MLCKKNAICSKSGAKPTDAISVQSVDFLNVETSKYKKVHVKLFLYTP